ncbi:unnamed protein product [Darwinula stevensoni]|uniref:Rab5 GDP/GTP exchange factor n=1 Tax=Darwinula stevensoni TaxID=69355 RepID=A0A7R9ACT9_9CRUS|nr:unnamed protein product [Darwinula stevensoni]CAG0900690.1 unnamed protein product [Darwinula stevensoni]
MATNLERTPGHIQFRIHDDLKCKNRVHGCDFYGNPSWEGYCSHCYRELVQKRKEQKAQKRSTPGKEGSATLRIPEKLKSLSKVRRSHSDVSGGTPSPQHESRFSRFEEKKKHQSDKRTTTLKSIMNIKSPRRDGKLRSQLRDVSEESREVTRSFDEFLRKLNQPASEDISKHIKTFLERTLRVMLDSNLDDLAEHIQNFYQSMSEKLASHPAFHSFSRDRTADLMDFIEKCVMTRLYKPIFDAISTTYEVKDLEVQNRIRSFNWVSSMHLDCGIQESRPDMREMIDEAITYIIEVDSKRAPQDKLSCIVKCAKQIFSVLQESKARSLMLDSESSASSVAISADDFLPALIYVVLKANPTRLHSNISYISRFCNPKRLMTGEGGYYFTNLCCAVEFIERIEASSLNLSEEEFERYMSGEALPPGGGWEGGVWLCEGMRLLRQSTKALHDLSQREEKLFTHAVELKQEMLLFQKGLEEQVELLMKNLPLEMKPRPQAPTLEVELDGDRPQGVDTLLPPPLLPEPQIQLSGEPLLPPAIPPKGGNQSKPPPLPPKRGGRVVTDMSILDMDSPDPDLPSPLKPAAYCGLAALNNNTIPTIPCDTGHSAQCPEPDGKPKVNETVVKVLSGLMDTFDNF